LERGLVLAAALLAEVERRPRRIEAAPLLGQPGLERGPRLRGLGQLAFHALQAAFGLLEPDQPLEFGVHRAFVRRLLRDVCLGDAF
jgi:hypothetical protein